MSRLPLFPLHTVLFPGMQMELHIFEERYKQMINKCQQDKSPFGIVLIKDGREAGDPLVKPVMVGCTAQVTDVHVLPDGRMNITIRGQERFQIQQIYRDLPYLSCEVKYFPLNSDEPIYIRKRAKKLRHLIIQYLRILEEVGQFQFDADYIPQNPVDIVYISAIILQTDIEKKQTLLETHHIKDLMNNLIKIYRLEVLLLAKRLNPPDESLNMGSFLMN